jgi:hypothetical protein
LNPGAASSPTQTDGSGSGCEESPGARWLRIEEPASTLSECRRMEAAALVLASSPVLRQWRLILLRRTSRR